LMVTQVSALESYICSMYFSVSALYKIF
jgi:hypothetical protein